MIVSEGNNVQKALQDLIYHTHIHPEHEPIVRRALDALKRTLLNTALFNDISIKVSPNLIKQCEPAKKTEKKESSQNEKAAIFVIYNQWNFVFPIDFRC